MDGLQLTGELVRIGEIQEFASGFTKREFRVKVNIKDDWDMTYPFELVKERCTLIDKFNEGDEITVSYNLCSNSGKEGGPHEDRLFLSLAAWRISGNSVAEQVQDGRVTPEDDLPF